ncbi:MAG: hypothetical protein WCR54_05345, partial [Clostridia bacterium]
AKKSIDLPIYTEGNFVYDGTEQTVNITANSDYTIGDECKETNAGDYVADVNLNDISNTQWSDKTNIRLVFDWSIAVKVVEKPVTKNVDFNSQEQTCGFVANADYELTGIDKATDAGNYQVTVSLKSITNLKWTDDTTEALLLDWSISKALVEKPVYNANDFVYNGTQQTVNITTNDTYYKLYNYAKIDADNYTVRAELKDKTNSSWTDNTTDDISYNWSIAKFDFATMANLTVSGEYSYTSVAIEPTYTVKDVKNNPINTLWYAPTFENNTNAGNTAKVIIASHHSSCQGTLEAFFNISKAQITVDVEMVQSYSTGYTGGVDYTITPNDALIYDVTITYNGESTTPPTSGTNNTVKIEVVPLVGFENNYIGVTVENIRYAINAINIANANIIMPNGTYVYYEGCSYTPTIESISYNSAGLMENTDYVIVEYINNNIATENAQIVIEGKGNFIGQVVITFTIDKAKIDKPVVNQTSFNYNGDEYSPIDYVPSKVIAEGNTQTQAGNHKAIFSLEEPSNYTWTDGTSDNFEVEWQINPIDISCNININTENSTFLYDGVAHQPTEIEISYNGIALVMGVDYEIIDNNSIEVGSYNLIIEAIEGSNYTGINNSTNYEIEYNWATLITVNDVHIENILSDEGCIYYFYDENAQRSVTVDLSKIPEGFVIKNNEQLVTSDFINLNMDAFKDAMLYLEISEPEDNNYIILIFLQKVYLDFESEYPIIDISDESDLEVQYTGFNFGFNNEITNNKIVGDIIINLVDGYKYEIYYNDIKLDNTTPLFYGEFVYTYRVFANDDTTCSTKLAERLIDINYNPSTTSEVATTSNNFAIDDNAVENKTMDFSNFEENPENYRYDNLTLTAVIVEADANGKVLLGIKTSEYIDINIVGYSAVTTWVDYTAFELDIVDETNYFIIVLEDGNNNKYSIWTNLNTNYPFNPTQYSDNFFKTVGVVNEINASLDSEEVNEMGWGEIPKGFTSVDYYYTSIMPFESVGLPVNYNFTMKEGYYISYIGLIEIMGTEYDCFNVYDDEEKNNYLGGFIVIIEYNDYNEDVGVDMIFNDSINENEIQRLYNDNPINRTVVTNEEVKFDFCNSHIGFELTDVYGILQEVDTVNTEHRYVILNSGTVTIKITSSDGKEELTTTIIFTIDDSLLNNISIKPNYTNALASCLNFNTADTSNDGIIQRDEIKSWGDAVYQEDKNAIINSGNVVEWDYAYLLNLNMTQANFDECVNVDGNLNFKITSNKSFTISNIFEGTNVYVPNDNTETSITMVAVPEKAGYYAVRIGLNMALIVNIEIV